jgi:hypothetical protein
MKNIPVSSVCLPISQEHFLHTSIHATKHTPHVNQRMTKGQNVRSLKEGGAGTREKKMEKTYILSQSV